jgi:hypothetical protein
LGGAWGNWEWLEMGGALAFKALGHWVGHQVPQPLSADRFPTPLTIPIDCTHQELSNGPSATTNGLRLTPLPLSTTQCPHGG